MDACLEILSPSVLEVDGLIHHQPSFVWGGTTYPQGPERLKWGDFVEVIRTPIAKHLRRYLPSDAEFKNWVALSIQGQGLDMLRNEVNGDKVDWNGRTLEQLLRLLVSQNARWVFVFELHCDQIDSVYTLSATDCIERFKQNLRLDAPTEGFVAIPH